ncbi:MAG: hypothetical protein AAFN77_18640 [Planctomycetota bacterium]
MEFLINLWLPILICGIVLFFTSSLFWTVLPHHEDDHKKAPDEEALMGAIRTLDLPAGPYMFPFLRHAEMKDEAKQELYKQGPRGLLIIWDIPNMGRNLGLTLTYFLLISLIIGYIAWEALGVDATFLKVFQIVGAMGLLVYCSSGHLRAIWFRHPKLMDTIDGIAYGVMSGLIFASLWPSPPAV